MSWRRLPRRSLAVSAVLSLGAVVPVDVVVVRVLHERDWTWGTIAAVAAVVAVLIVAGIVAYEVARLRATRWRLTRERLELRSGVVSRQHRSVPRDRVRSVDLRADPVRRAFGLTVVKIGTGGHGDENAELTLDPLTVSEAETLRRVLLSGAPADAFLTEDPVLAGEPSRRDELVSATEAAWGSAPFRKDEAPQGNGLPEGDETSRRSGRHRGNEASLGGGRSRGSAASRGNGPSQEDEASSGHGSSWGGGPAGAMRAVEVVARLRWPWVRYAPLTVWSFAGAALVLGVLYKPLDALGVEVFSAETAALVWGWLTERPWVTIPVVVAGNVAAGVTGALLIFVESWGGYRLEREPGRPGAPEDTGPDARPASRDGRWRVRRGLLTSRSLTLDESRLRGVEIREPLLLRLGGGARVTAVATGLGKAREGETEDVAALTPPLPQAEAVRIAALVAGGRLPAPVPHPAAARRRRVRRALIAAVVPAVALAAMAMWIRNGGAEAWTRGSGLGAWAGGGGLGSWAGTGDVQAWIRDGALEAWVWGAVAAVLLLVLPLALLVAVAGYRGLGHGLGGRHLLARSGAVVRRTVALDRGGIVGWTITQSYVQRRAGLLTVSATTAAGDGHYDVVDVGGDTGLELAARAVPGLLDPFLVRSGPGAGCPPTSRAPSADAAVPSQGPRSF
ncbi:PH domain-containing protein [Nonomuraea roseoviolacea]|uniref:Membrane protein n=1 Tax=Nonomuraea roseoviolacea subsp. carminata TaxID=160689 RepID=A0ABT1JRS5_9ACTN|nr:PH domain-containing protein [Nonomuraea roseoviolacea]MCP2344444.1 putative membrane protein [Nonomuraea roseoviolacea subsp. carminata]